MLPRIQMKTWKHCWCLEQMEPEGIHRYRWMLVNVKSLIMFFCFPSASSGGGWIFGFQALLETAKQDTVVFVLLVLLGVELPLDLEASVDHEG